ncbi:unnamed protein product [Gordionus sp. m RMFG-2023]
MSQLTSWMNRSVDPCTDFYEFACGGYIQKTSIPSGFNEWNPLKAMSESILLTIKDILENPHTKYEARAERLAKTYYDSCMDEANIIEKLGGKPLTDLLDLYGGWDVLNVDNKSSPFIDESSSLKKIRYPDGFLANFGFIFFELYPCLDPKNSSKYILCISPGELTLPYRDDYYSNATYNITRYDAYLEYMMNVGNLLVYSAGAPKFSKTGSKDRRCNQSDTNLTCHASGKEDYRTQINNGLAFVMKNVLIFEWLLTDV